MQNAYGHAVALVLACAASSWGAAQAFAADIVVSNTNDAVNGVTSSPQALKSNPGPDGISLREALLAANNVPGPHVITFAPSLVGKTITLSSTLPPVTRDGITITGRLKSAKPAITINGKAATGGATLFVAASSFTISAMKFIFCPPHYSTISIAGGQPGFSAIVKKIQNIRISGNAFTHSGAASDGFAIGSPGFRDNLTISDVVVDNNSFDGVQEAVNIGPGGSNHVLQDILVYRNTFKNSTAPATSAVEFGVHDGKNNRILRSHIMRNVFINNFAGISLNINRDAGPSGGQDTTTTGNVIDRTTIEGNTFIGNGSISISSGVGGGGSFVPVGNTISNTSIVNNVFTGSTSNVAAHLMDNQNGAHGNKVKTVLFFNNTVNNTNSGPTPPAILIDTVGGIIGVKVRNTIFWKASAGGENNAVSTVSPPVVVDHSIINQSPFVGGTNFNANPLFVNAARNNFGLQNASPAKGAGTATGAPVDDADCQPRAAPPSIGAYEFNGPNICPAQP